MSVLSGTMEDSQVRSQVLVSDRCTAWLQELDGVVFRDYNAPFMKAMALWVEQLVELLQ